MFRRLGVLKLKFNLALAILFFSMSAFSQNFEEPRKPLTQKSYLIGGALSTIVGFGSGHAFHGRFKKSPNGHRPGKDYLIYEAATLAVAAGGFMVRNSAPEGNSLLEIAGQFVGIIGFGGFLYFKGHEIYDSWNVKIQIRPTFEDDFAANKGLIGLIEFYH